MKYRLGSKTIEAIDVYVRVTVEDYGGIGNPKRYAVTKKQCPSASDVANMLAELQGYYPDPAQLQACGRAAADAKNNMIELVL